MKNLHLKSLCCRAKIIRFGGKRRQCSRCKKTWTIRPKRRGRKLRHCNQKNLRKVFELGFFVKNLPNNRKLATKTIYKRFAKDLEKIISHTRHVRIRGRQIILLVDAERQKFGGRYWTLYFVAARPVNKDEATILDPVLKPGRENLEDWSNVINSLPVGLKDRTVAVVSDGISGFVSIVLSHGWIHQRCHFHLISALQKFKGGRKKVNGRQTRKKIFKTYLQFCNFLPT